MHLSKSVNFHHTTRHNIPEDSRLHPRSPETLEFQWLWFRLIAMAGSVHTTVRGLPHLAPGIHDTQQWRWEKYNVQDNYYVEKLHARWWLSASSISLHWSCINFTVAWPRLYCHGQVSVCHFDFLSYARTRKLLKWQTFWTLSIIPV
jgi:hypothetical protein